MYDKVCEFCGESFRSKRPEARFCSPAHKAAWHRAQEGRPFRRRRRLWVRDRDHDEARLSRERSLGVRSGDRP